MKTLRIEFFHDVLCAWCYILSPRLRKLKDEVKDIEIIHRCFPLAPSPEYLKLMYGSKENAKKEILSHWRNANENDDERRINADLMEKREFDYPYSTPGLLACKAAEIQGGQEAHWDLFDRIQKAHLTECFNIADFEILKKCASDVGLDVKKWEQDFKSEKVKVSLINDIEMANFYGISGVPSLIVNQKYLLQGAYKYDVLKMVINDLLEKIE